MRGEPRSYEVVALSCNRGDARIGRVLRGNFVRSWLGLPRPADLSSAPTPPTGRNLVGGVEGVEGVGSIRIGTRGRNGGPPGANAAECDRLAL